MKQVRTPAVVEARQHPIQESQAELDAKVHQRETLAQEVKRRTLRRMQCLGY